MRQPLGSVGGAVRALPTLTATFAGDSSERDCLCVLGVRSTLRMREQARPWSRRRSVRLALDCTWGCSNGIAPCPPQPPANRVKTAGWRSSCGTWRAQRCGRRFFFAAAQRDPCGTSGGASCLRGGTQKLLRGVTRAYLLQLACRRRCTCVELAFLRLTTRIAVSWRTLPPAVSG